MIHTLLIGAVYVAMVLTPCVIALFAGIDSSEEPQDSGPAGRDIAV
jgi:hypothetical protein